MRIAAAPQRRRGASLTPMIDVVFLLLVFFMLAARFGGEQALTLAAPGAAAGAPWSGPPRLVEVGENGIRLNGLALTPAALPDALRALSSGPGDAVVLRPDGADVGRLATVLSALAAAGFTDLVVVE